MTISRIISILALLFFCATANPAYAVKLPEGLKEAIKQKFPNSKFRIDSTFEDAGSFYIPVVPTQSKKVQSEKIGVSFSAPDIVCFDNGWIFLKLVKSGNKLVLNLPAGLSPELMRALYSGALPADLLVPENMAVSGKLKPLVKELNVEILKDGTPPAIALEPQEEPAANTNEKIFLASPASGKIFILNSKFEKESEVPSDGTPSGLVYFQDKLIVADQSKSLVIIYNSQTMKWDTFIEFPMGSSPRSVAVAPKGDIIYVAEQASSTVASVDLATKKILQRTKVLTGPCAIAITPDGYTLVVANSGSGHVSFISTLNQKVVGALLVGKMPTNLLISKKQKYAYVSNRMSNTVSVIDIPQRKVICTINVGEGPTGLALDATEERLFVANAKDNNISVHSTANNFEKIETVSLPMDVEFPGCLLLTADQNHLLVTSAASDTVGFLNLETLKFDKQVQIGKTTMEAVSSL